MKMAILLSPRLTFCGIATGLVNLAQPWPEDCRDLTVCRLDCGRGYRLVEEFMLLANMSVAKKIYDAFPRAALLRRHAPPLQQKVDEVIFDLQRLGIELDASE